MSVMTFEGVVTHGQIQLKTKLWLPENTKVYVVVPEAKVEAVAHVFSPRLAHPKQAADFKLEIVEDAARFDPPAPLAQVALQREDSAQQWVDVPMLLDSGADVALLPKAVMDHLRASHPRTLV